MFRPMMPRDREMEESESLTEKMQSKSSEAENSEIAEKRKNLKAEIIDRIWSAVMGKTSSSVDQSQKALIEKLKLVRIDEGLDGKGEDDDEIAYQIVTNVNSAIKNFGKVIVMMVDGDILPQEIKEMLDELLEQIRDKIEEERSLNLDENGEEYERAPEQEINNYEHMKAREIIESRIKISERITTTKSDGGFKEMSKKQIEEYKNDLLEKAASEIELKYINKTIKDAEQHKVKCNEINKRLKSMDKLRKEQNELNAMISYADNDDLVIRTLISKISDYVKTHSKLNDAIKRATVVKVSFRRVENPLKEGNLTAIIQNLYNDFIKGRLTTFIDQLQPGFKNPIPRQLIVRDPTLASDKIAKIMKKIENSGSEDLLTMDNISVCMTMNQLHFAPFHLILELHNLLESEDKGLHEGTIIRKGKMHLTNVVRDHLTKYKEKVKDITKQRNDAEESENGGKRSDLPGGSNRPQKPFSQNNYGKRTNTEEAHGASENDETVDGENEVANNVAKVNKERKQSFQKLLQKGVSEKFNRKVFKSEGIGAKNGNGELVVPYVAVLEKHEICAKCYPKGESKEKPCERKCYEKECSKCGYLGHSSIVCLQAKNKDGTDI